MSQPHFGISVREIKRAKSAGVVERGRERVNPTFPRVRTWSPPGLPNSQSSSSGVETPLIVVFFIPLERS
jgi:hypothetical protein